MPRLRFHHVTIAMVSGAIACGVAFLFFSNVTQAPAGKADTPPATAVQQLPAITYENVTQPDNVAAYIAHAMGEIDGNIYTNSLEAFQLNYARGFRLFECDFVYLKDGTVFVAHDDHEAEYALAKPFRESTKEDVANLRQEGKYTPLYSKEVIELMRTHPDVLLLLDTKMNHVEIVQQLVKDADADPAILDRLVPHVSDQANYDAIMAVYPFKTTMLALYRMLQLSPATEGEIVHYMQKNKITAVMMNRKEDDPTLAIMNNGDKPGTFSFKRFHNRLQEARIPHYVHSVGNKAEMEKFRKLGVGMYLDIPFKQ